MTDHHESERIRLLEKMNRIRLAMFIGWTAAEDHSDNPEWRGMAFSPNGSGPMSWPNPFEDANDDFAILERMRKLGKKHGVWNYQNADSVKWMRAISDFCKFARDYQIGDYARAALKVLEGEGS